MSIHLNGMELTKDAESVLTDLQRSNNDFINVYQKYLDNIADILFSIGNNRDLDESKDDMFELLNTTHLLRKDLNALRAPINNESKN